MSIISEVGKSLSMCVKKTLNRCQLSFRRSVARDRFLSTVTYSIMSFECSPRYSHSPSFLIFICIPCFGCLLTWAGRLRVIKCRCFFFVVVLFFRRPRHTLEIAQYGPYTLLFCTGKISHGRSVTMDWTLDWRTEIWITLWT